MLKHTIFFIAPLFSILFGLSLAVQAIPFSTTNPPVSQQSVRAQLAEAEANLGKWVQYRAKVAAQQPALNQCLTVKGLQLTYYNTELMSYLNEHREAALAIVLGVGGVHVALDEDNQFSQEARQGAGALAALAALYALSHAEEVAEVAEVMMNASQKLKQLQADFNLCQSQLEQVKQNLRQADTQIAAHKEIIARLKRQLASSW